MKKKDLKNKYLLIILLLILGIRGVSSQISEYQHPCTILGQNKISIDVNTKYTILPSSLIIHDIDEKCYDDFDLFIEPGKNYDIKFNSIIPKHNFKGELSVNVKVFDGTFYSNIFPLSINVGNVKANLGKKFYVSINGKDTNKGTNIFSPFKSLSRAVREIRRIILSNGLLKGGFTVYLTNGDYYMDKKIILDSVFRGEKGSEIRFVSFANKVRLTGSKVLPIEKFVSPSPLELNRVRNKDARSHIKVIDLKELGLTDYGNLDHVGYGVRNSPLPTSRISVDGNYLHLARYPNGDNFDDVRSPIGKASFKSVSGRPLLWDFNVSDDNVNIWIDGALSKAWEWQKNKIESVGLDSTIVSKWDFYSEIGVQPIKMFYFNVFEELDSPGEYYINTKTGKLYVYFPDNISKNPDIRLSESRDKFFEINGAKYVVFNNIEFEGTRNTGIEIDSSSNITISNCDFVCLGLNGIDIEGTNNTVENTILHDIGGVGISLKGGDFKTLKPALNVVENCKIYDCSKERRAYNPEISVRGIGQIVRHTELYDCPHMAMTVSGEGHVIEYNDIHDAPKEYSDMLSVYFCTGNSPFNRGVVVRRNKFHDAWGNWKKGSGVYMDNETCGVLVAENYFYNNNAKESGWSVMIHGGADNVVVRNAFINCSFPFLISLRFNGYAAEKFPIFLEKWQKEFQEKMNANWAYAYPELNRYFDDEGITPENLELSNPASYVYRVKKDSTGFITNYWDRRTPNSNVFSDNVVFNSSDSIFAMPQSKPQTNSYNHGFYYTNTFRIKDGKNMDNLIHKNNLLSHDYAIFRDYENHDFRIYNFSKEYVRKVLDTHPFLMKNFFYSIGYKGDK